MKQELEVMQQIARALEPLEPAAKTRVLVWVISALGVEGISEAKFSAATDSKSQRAQSDEMFGLSTFAEFFHTTDPKSEKEKALVAAYWIQRTNGVDQFASQQVNTELKHIGYRITNITDALTQLIDDRPSLVVQLTKSGQSKQARKTYKVTDAGIRYVQEMLSGAALA